VTKTNDTTNSTTDTLIVSRRSSSNELRKGGLLRQAETIFCHGHASARRKRSALSMIEAMD